MEKLREFNYPENIFKDPESENMSEDISRLIGYCVSLGWTNKIFPAEHCKELSNYFLERMMTYPTHPNSECQRCNDTPKLLKELDRLHKKLSVRQG